MSKIKVTEVVLESLDEDEAVNEYKLSFDGEHLWIKQGNDTVIIDPHAWLKIDETIRTFFSGVA